MAKVMAQRRLTSKQAWAAGPSLFPCPLKELEGQDNLT